MRDFTFYLELFDQKYKRLLTYAALVWKSIKTVQTQQWDIQNFFYFITELMEWMFVILAEILFSIHYKMFLLEWRKFEKEN